MTSQKPRKIVRKKRDETGKITTTAPATMLRMPVIPIQGRHRISDCPIARKSSMIQRAIQEKPITVASTKSVRPTWAYRSIATPEESKDGRTKMELSCGSVGVGFSLGEG